MFFKRDTQGIWVFKTFDGDRSELSFISAILMAAAHEGVGGKAKGVPKFKVSLDGTEHTFASNVELFQFASGLNSAISYKKVKEQEIKEATDKAVNLINKGKNGK